MNYKRVYILGAGSSIGHSKGLFPSITEFFAKAKKLKLNLQDEFNELKNYAQKMLGKFIFDGRTRINIEDLFTHIEIDIERKSSWELLAIRQQIFKLIQVVLTALESQIHEPNGEYNDFLNELTPIDTIITFNWDLLLDNVLGRRYAFNNFKINRSFGGSSRFPQYYNFISKLSAFGEMVGAFITIKEPYHKWHSERGYYLKAHGSIDWFYCPNEGCKISHKVFPLLESTINHFCSECHESLEPLIIPPVLNKGYRHYPLIRRIWNLATKELSSADEIIIWGYSLPPTDFYSSWLIRQARESSIRKLILINPDVISMYMSKPRLNTEYVKRFYDIFRDKISSESIYLYESFGEYLTGTEIMKKYNLEPRKV